MLLMIILRNDPIYSNLLVFKPSYGLQLRLIFIITEIKR